MMGADLRAHLQPLLFGPADHLHAVLCGAMAQMQPGSRFLCQQNIPGHDHILHRIDDALQAQSLRFFICIHHTVIHQMDVLTVGQHRKIQFRGNLHSLPVNLGIHHRFSIFTDGRNPGFRHTPDIGYRLSLLFHGHSTHLKHMNGRHLSRFIFHIPHFIRCIDHRLRVGHGQHSGVAASGSCFGAGLYIFFIGQSRIPEMHMQVHQPRHHKTSGGIHHPGILLLQIFSHFPDHTICHKDVTDLIPVRSRIQHSSILNQ